MDLPTAMTETICEIDILPNSIGQVSARTSDLRSTSGRCSPHLVPAPCLSLRFHATPMTHAPPTSPSPTGTHATRCSRVPCLLHVVRLVHSGSASLERVAHHPRRLNITSNEKRRHRDETAEGEERDAIPDLFFKTFNIRMKTDKTLETCF
jgi:hypothetical protein